MKQIMILVIALALSGCSSLLRVDYKIDTNAQISQQRVLPMKIQSIQTDVDEKLAYQIVPHCTRSSGECHFSKPLVAQKTQVDIYGDMKQALQIALQDAFARTKLFAEQSDRLVNVKATFVSFQSENGVVSHAKTAILYQFFNAKTGELIYKTTINSTCREFEMNWITVFFGDDGREEHQARNDAVANNIMKLLKELNDDKKNAPFFRQPEN